MTRKCVGLASAVLCLATLTVASLRATAQMPDRIEFDGREYRLLVNPLEDYFAKHPERRPSPPIQASFNWRGYVAQFAVVNDELRVADVRVMTGDAGGQRSVLRDVFPGNDRLVATWFTGNLLIADGDVTDYVHMGYASDYERYIVIPVEAGAAAAPRRLSAREFAAFRQAQFDAFTRTDRYRAIVKEANRTEPRMNPAQFERFAFAFFTGDYMMRIVK